ncbi:UNVERIFIED_CONTAM: hypothetical protein Sradi_6161100 [Sesamum radiatum]|uniref:Ribosomal protein L2 n=1 Tax=Sesamum radiatum TaxID=300843 RepID=A0AAW2K7L2_SESRA
MGDRGRPRNTTHGTAIGFRAVHEGPLAKTSGRGKAPHCGQILRPDRKARRHVGRAVWEHYEMSAY